MVTQQRGDLQMNIPALRKLDAMLIVRPSSHVLEDNLKPKFVHLLTLSSSLSYNVSGLS